MNKQWILSQPDNSITDPIIIREIAIQSIEENDSSLLCKVKSGFEVHGLYPNEIKKLNIKPTQN